MYRYMYMYIYVYSIHLSSSSWRNVDELCTKFGRTNDSRGPHEISHKDWLGPYCLEIVDFKGKRVWPGQTRTGISVVP